MMIMIIKNNCKILPTYPPTTNFTINIITIIDKKSPV